MDSIAEDVGESGGLLDELNGAASRLAGMSMGSAQKRNMFQSAVNVPPPPAGATMEELKRTYQVDLNDSAQLGDLEDAGLIGHMEQARNQLAAQIVAAEKLALEEKINATETSGRRSLSTLMNDIREQRLALACVRDGAFLHASNAEKLAAGIQPHGYPTNTQRSNPSQLVYLSAQLMTTGNELERICNNLESAECELIRARRDLETAAFERTQRCAHFEKAWTELQTTIKQ